MYDRAAGWLDCFTKASNSTAHTVEAFQEWSGTGDRIDSFHCDSAPELLAAARKCGWRCHTATKRMPRTNGIAERRVREIKEGGRCAMV
jgi:hypothetical protein